MHCWQGRILIYWQNHVFVDYYGQSFSWMINIDLCMWARVCFFVFLCLSWLGKSNLKQNQCFQGKIIIKDIKIIVLVPQTKFRHYCINNLNHKHYHSSFDHNVFSRIPREVLSSLYKLFAEHSILYCFNNILWMISNFSGIILFLFKSDFSIDYFCSNASLF